MRSNEPLGLPAGSVRAIMTIILLVVVCILCLMKQPVPDILSQCLLVSLGMYHIGRAAGKATLIPIEDEDDPAPVK